MWLFIRVFRVIDFVIKFVVIIVFVVVFFFFWEIVDINLGIVVLRVFILICWLMILVEVSKINFGEIFSVLFNFLVFFIVFC